MDNLLYENDKKVNVRVLSRVWRGECPGELHGEGKNPHGPSPTSKDRGKSLEKFRANSGINWGFTAQVKAKQWRCLKTFIFFWSDDLLAFLIARM